MTTSWHGGAVAATGAIGWAMAFSHAASISSTGRPMPTRIDARRGRQRADRNRNVVTAAAGSTTLVNRKARRCVLAEPALELPAHQRMQLGVLVDRALDPHQQALCLERGQMRLEIERRPVAGSCGWARVAADVEHGPCL